MLQAGTWLEQPRSKPCSLLQFWRFVSDAKIAKRYFVSGMVQGVGFRYFTQAAAERLRIHGFVRNLRDGRVKYLPWCATAARGISRHAGAWTAFL